MDFLLAQRALVQRDGQWVLLEEEEATEAGVPQSLQQMIESSSTGRKLEQQRLLEAASIAGVEFSAVVVAAALGIEVEQIEEWCEGWHWRSNSSCGELEVACGRTEHRQRTMGSCMPCIKIVLHQCVTMTRRQRLHQRIGEREEVGYGEQVREIAAELCAAL